MGLIDPITDRTHHLFIHRNDRDDLGHYLHPTWVRWWRWLNWRAESGILWNVVFSCTVYVFGFAFIGLAFILMAIHSGAITPDEAWELLSIREK